MAMAFSIIRTTRSFQFIGSCSSSLGFTAKHRFFRSTAVKMIDFKCQLATGRIPPPDQLSMRTMGFENPAAGASIIRIPPHGELLIAFCTRCHFLDDDDDDDQPSIKPKMK